MFWRGHNHLAGCKCKCGGLQLQVWGPANAAGGGLQMQPQRPAIAARPTASAAANAAGTTARCVHSGCIVQPGGLHGAVGHGRTAADAQPRSTARQRGPLHMQPLHMQLELLQVQQEPSCKCSRFLYRVYLHMLHVQAFYLHVQPAELHVQRGGLQMQRSFCICSDARCTCSCICSAPGCTDTLRVQLHVQPNTTALAAALGVGRAASAAA